MADLREIIFQNGGLVLLSRDAVETEKHASSICAANLKERMSP